MIRSSKDVKALQVLTGFAVAVVVAGHPDGALGWLIVAILVIGLELIGHALPRYLEGGMKPEGRRWHKAPKLRHAAFVGLGLAGMKLLAHSGGREFLWHVLLPVLLVGLAGMAMNSWVRKKVLLKPPRFDPSCFGSSDRQSRRRQGPRVVTILRFGVKSCSAVLSIQVASLTASKIRPQGRSHPIALPLRYPAP